MYCFPLALLKSCFSTGMNKLVKLLPDTTRDQVRDQAIVLVQKLTISNEEMKKTVAFNEVGGPIFTCVHLNDGLDDLFLFDGQGFEILFGIIDSEGGSEDSGLVVEDCLRIINNILFASVTNQRLFFGMGQGWLFKLMEFFDASLLERLEVSNDLAADDDDEAVSWYDIPNRSKCAYLALDAIASSLAIINSNHQNTAGIALTSLIPSAAHWLGRQGPSYMTKAALNLIECVVENNKSVAARLMETTLKLSPSQPGKTVPVDAEMRGLTFGWRPLPSDERRCINLTALLAERYVYPCTPWCGAVRAAGLLSTPSDTALPGGPAPVDSVTSDSFSMDNLRVLEAIFAADPDSTGMMIQYILAPPPPLPDDDDMAVQGVQGSLESMRPLGSILTLQVVEVCAKFLEGSALHLQGSNNTFRMDLESAERCANVLSLIFLHGGQLSRELSTALSTSHIVASSGGRTGSSFAGALKQPLALLPMLLSSAGRAARVPGGHTFVVSILRVLAVVASECERAARQVGFFVWTISFVKNLFGCYNFVSMSTSMNCISTCSSDDSRLYDFSDEL